MLLSRNYKAVGEDRCQEAQHYIWVHEQLNSQLIDTAPARCVQGGRNINIICNVYEEKNEKTEQTDMTCIKCLWNCHSYSKNGLLATVLANGDRRPLTLASSVLN